VAAVATGAWVAGTAAPLIGAPVFALLTGLAIRNTLVAPAFLIAGAEFTLRRLLRLAIILFGTTLSFTQIAHIGGASIVVVGVTVVLALVLVSALGRWLGAPSGLASLIGIGTAICGVTAILTVGPIIRSREEEIAFAVTTIFLFNMAAVLVYPALGHLLAMSDSTFGVWVGAAVHDTSSVLAASFSFSEPAGRVATVVKLLRTLALVPLALGYGIAYSLAHREDSARVSVVRIFPWFVVWLMLAALLNTLGVVGAEAGRWAALGGKFLVVMVMAAVGLSAGLGQMTRIGLLPLGIGMAASVMIAAISLSLIRLLMR
jgi:uncharacterized integral membrane protein (TIGR00698 family)